MINCEAAQPRCWAASIPEMHQPGGAYMWQYIVRRLFYMVFTTFCGYRLSPLLSSNFHRAIMLKPY
jgi:hypothetical protein